MDQPRVHLDLSMEIYFENLQLDSPRETQILSLEPGQSFAAGINPSQVELGDKLKSFSGA